MTSDTALVKTETSTSRTAAQLAGWGALAFVLLLAVLHLVKPDLDPSWHFISEYAIGAYGWVMVLAFLALAASYVALFVALRGRLRTVAGRIGLALLLVSAAGLIIGALFTTDPIMTPPDAATTAGSLHSLGGTLGFAMPFAALFVSWSMARDHAWSFARRPLYAAAGLALLGFAASFLALSLMLAQSGGQFGPDVSVGWPNRLEMLAYVIWLIVVARYAARSPSQER